MTDTKTIKVGLLGLGTVGTGVYKLIGRSESADRSVERDYRR